MTKIKYISDGYADEVAVFGYAFSHGKAVTVSPEVAAKLKGNPFFEVVTEKEPTPATPKAATKPATPKPAAEKSAAEGDKDGEGDPDKVTLKAVHIAGGRFVIKNGDVEIKKGLNKPDADAFNAMSDEDKAEYVKD